MAPLPCTAYMRRGYSQCGYNTTWISERWVDRATHVCRSLFQKSIIGICILLRTWGFLRGWCLRIFLFSNSIAWTGEGVFFWERGCAASPRGHRVRKVDGHIPKSILLCSEKMHTCSHISNTSVRGNQRNERLGCLENMEPWS